MTIKELIKSYYGNVDIYIDNSCNLSRPNFKTLYLGIKENIPLDILDRKVLSFGVSSAKNNCLIIEIL